MKIKSVMRLMFMVETYTLSDKKFACLDYFYVNRYWKYIELYNGKTKLYTPHYRLYQPVEISDNDMCWKFYADVNDNSDKINQWILEKNIILSKENDYEIPDEYKAEFKLRFH